MAWRRDTRRRPDGGNWRCVIHKREIDAAYGQSAKGRARKKKFNDSQKSHEIKSRYERKRVRVKVAGMSFQYRIPEGTRGEVVRKLTEKRAIQRTELKEAMTSGR